MKLHSKDLLPGVSDSPWYTLYRDGDEIDSVAAISLSRFSFKNLIAAFKIFFGYKIGVHNKKGGRSPR